ncbi:MAG: ParB/RepB/Spo0J family partition protein [Candidatus Kaiserbacteria bacterium]|nr:ParB/RepB/Spo0J family partition protein [Candidatus Kaiserbacteria bacterium]MCB9815792.1 ParB/RepB/Spo0J family partition protein [Candidatus Nomurabacteria bacterium]
MAFQGDSIYWVEVEKVVPNPFQPRREFDQNKLQELADSIRMYGVLQPLTVTRKEIQREDGTFYSEYELIAGERRMRASKLAGVAQVPVIIREGEQSEQEKLELAIIENLQREDLNAVDRALAFRQLADAFGLSHAQVAQKVGRSREYVSNSIRLLGLPDHMLDSLKIADMMEGHARTLLMLTDRPEEQEVVYKEILLKKLSVREVERIVRKIATDKVRKKNPLEFDESLIEFEKKFTETLGTRVQIQKTDFGGKLTIDYFSEEDLEAILQRMAAEVAASQPVESTTYEMVNRLTEHTPLSVDEESVESASYEQSRSVQEMSVREPQFIVTRAVTYLTTPVPEPVQEEAVDDSGSLASYIQRPPEPSFTPRREPSFVAQSFDEPVSEPAPEKQPESPQSDDSGLYSIRNFTV